MMDDVPDGPSIGVGMSRTGVMIKEGIVGSLKGINEIEAEIISLVRTTVCTTLRATGSVASDGIAGDIVKGVLQAVEEVGAGLTLGVKSVAKGVIMGVSDVGGDICIAAHHAVKGAVSGAAEIGADVGVVASRAVSGVIEAVSEIGGNGGMAARAAVEGALEAAGAISSAMVKMVREILISAAADGKEAVRAVFPQSLQVNGVRQGLALVH